MFDKLFDVFSRRDQSKAKLHPVPLEFRARVLMLLQDELGYSFEKFLDALHRKVAYLQGKFNLSSSASQSTTGEDLARFLETCKDEQFLDVVELIFRSNLPGITWPDNALIPCINEFFKADNLPYHLTGYSMEEFPTTFHGTARTGTRISEYPSVIRKDSEILHQNAIQPALQLLAKPGFQSANSEFLKALEDFRKNDFADCLTKCGSAFESVMKVLCKSNSIACNETDTASTLLRALLANGQIDGYWEQPLILIATLRNRLSSSHGAGAQTKNVPQHVANYVVNATASAILFLDGEFS